MLCGRYPFEDTGDPAMGVNVSRCLAPISVRMLVVDSRQRPVHLHAHDHLIKLPGS